MASKTKDDGDDQPGAETAPRSYDDAAHENQSLPVNESELAGMTLFEKKCHLINKEIDSMGMGKYQWCLWTLCGFGYLLDLTWAQAFGLVLTPLQQELGIPANQGGNISTAFSAGLTAGAAFWGIAVDIIGRRWAFNLTCGCSAIFGLALAGSMNYTTFLVLTAFVGFGVGGNVPIDTTIALEFLPQNRRRLLPLLSVFQPIGVVITTGIAYAFIPSKSCAKGLPSCQTDPDVPCCGVQNNIGWRYTLITVGCITTFVFLLRVVAFRFHESPKFLIHRGKDNAAITVIEKVSKFNGHQPKLTLQHFENLSDDSDSVRSDTPMLDGSRGKQQSDWKKKAQKGLERYKYLFSNFTLARLTILVWITYACDFWGFTISGTFTPQILLAKGASNGQTIYDTYRSYVYIYLPGIAGVLLGVWGYDLPRIGRQWTMVFSSALMAASLILFATVNSQESNIGISVMEYFFQSMFNSVLYGWTPEAFPSFIRGTACGFASFFGRLFSIIAPIAAQSLLPPLPPDQIPWQDYAKLLYMGGGVAFGATAALILLPRSIMAKESM